MARPRETTFTDARIDANALASDFCNEWLILEGDPSQDDWLADWIECPRCAREGHPHGNRYCLVCDRAGADGRVGYPGLPIGYAMAPDWPADPPVYGPASAPTKVNDRRGKITLPDGRELV